MQVLASLLADLIRRRPIDRIVFNLAQLALSWIVAGAVFEALGGAGFGDPGGLQASDLPAIAICAVVFFVANSTLVRTAEALLQRIAIGRPPARRPPLPELVGRHAVRARPAGRRDRRQLALPRAHARAADGGGAPRVEAGVGDGAPRAPRSDDLASEPRSAPPADRRRPPERRPGDSAAQHRPRPLPGRERHAWPRAGRRGPDRDRREAEALRAIDGHGRARGGRPLRRAAARPPKRQGRCGRGRREDRGGPQPPDRRGERHAERGRHRRDRVRPRSRQQRRAAAPARGGGDVPREARADAARVLLTRARGGGAAPARARDRAEARDRHPRDHAPLPAEDRARAQQGGGGGGARALDGPGARRGGAQHLRAAGRAHRPRRAAHRARGRDRRRRLPPLAGPGLLRARGGERVGAGSGQSQACPSSSTSSGAPSASQTTPSRSRSPRAR